MGNLERFHIRRWWKLNVEKNLLSALEPVAWLCLKLFSANSTTIPAVLCVWSTQLSMHQMANCEGCIDYTSDLHCETDWLRFIVRQMATRNLITSEVS